MNNTIAKILDGILMSALLIAVTEVFVLISPENLSDYIYLPPVILGFIAGYFKLFGGIFQNEK